MCNNRLNGKDLVLAFLYSPGKNDLENEPITGRTRLSKMMFLFEQELNKEFFADLINELPNFYAYNYGPFSRELFENLDFFISIGFIAPSPTEIPISEAENEESKVADEESFDDEWGEASFSNSDDVEQNFSLSPKGKKYVENEIWGNFSEVQKDKLRRFKRQINTISLDALLRYVYTKYPDMTENSLIKSKYIK